MHAVRSEQLVREKADAYGELESLKAQIADDMAKARFELQEFEVTVETYRAENEKLRQEIAEMSGDDMRNERELRNEREERTAARRTTPATPERSSPAAPSPPAPSLGEEAPVLLQQRSSRVSVRPERRKSTSSDMGNVLARDLDITGRHDELCDLLEELTEMLNSMGIAREERDQILHWGTSFQSSAEKWFEVAEDKFAAFEKGGAEMGRRIKDLELQRNRLEKDLEMRTDKVRGCVLASVFVW